MYDVVENSNYQIIIFNFCLQLSISLILQLRYAIIICQMIKKQKKDSIYMRVIC